MSTIIAMASRDGGRRLGGFGGLAGCWLVWAGFGGVTDPNQTTKPHKLPQEDSAKLEMPLSLLKLRLWVVSPRPPQTHGGLPFASDSNSNRFEFSKPQSFGKLGAREATNANQLPNH